jgi:uncharacterized protein (DUF4415 family)
MPKNRKPIRSDLKRVDAHRVSRKELKEAPPLTAKQLANAVVRDGDKVVRRGRPPLENPKQAVKLRLDADVLAYFKKRGAGWQTRINDSLRKVVGLK